MHDDLEIAEDVYVKSLGKLTIYNYIKELEKSHIGISFMASPHPSYPPLEMATFGLYTITNKFAGKDISGNHHLLHCVDYPLPDELVCQLKKAVTYVSSALNDPLEVTLPSTMSPLSWADNLRSIKIDPIISTNLA